MVTVHGGRILISRLDVLRYIPDYMTFDYVQNSMAALVEDDWKAKFDALSFGEDV